jgi:hypothetical protein
MSLFCEVQHLVAGGCHASAGCCEAGVGAHKAQAAGKEAVQQGVLGQVQRHLTLQRHLSSVGTWTKNNRLKYQNLT